MRARPVLPASHACRLLLILLGVMIPSVATAAITYQDSLQPSVLKPGDWFGYSSALSGDTLVVGAHSDSSGATGVNGDPNDTSAPDSGAAYVFVRRGTKWSQQAYLKASNTGEGDHFGWSVAVSGDTVVVGARGEDSTATGVNGIGIDPEPGFNSGAAYVFVRQGTNWSQQAYLKASNTGEWDDFGASVTVSGDTIVVGAGEEQSNATGVNGNQADNSLSGAGAAYVFVRSGTNWSQQAYLKASNPGYGDVFGSAVAASGDTVLVTAGYERSNATGVNGNQSDNSALWSGAAYVFVRSGTNWTQQAYLKASDTHAGDQFGEEAAAIDGDTIVIGAIQELDDSEGFDGPGTGVAYVFARNGTNWSQQARLKASNAELADRFGRSVSISGDTIVVGATDESSGATGVNGDQTDNNSPYSGAVYVFARSGTNWTQQAYLKGTIPVAWLGWSVAVSGDTVAVPAMAELAAHIFVGTGPLVPQLSIELTGGGLRVFWPLPATGLVLDEVPALNASPVTGWGTVPVGSYQTNATHVSFNVPQPSGQKFYRLRRP